MMKTKINEKVLEVKNLEVSFHTFAGVCQAVRGVNFHQLAEMVQRLFARRIPVHQKTFLSLPLGADRQQAESDYVAHARLPKQWLNGVLRL